MNKRIILTGGGTAGHVTPNLALTPMLLAAGFEVHYIGSYNGLEKELVAHAGIAYYGISSGKMRRYIDLKNLSDPFRVLRGAGQALKLMRTIKPQVVFSKGGFVSVPVVFAAWLCGVPAVIHESDITPGLANKLCIPLCRKICTTFETTAKGYPGKGVYTGSPIRRQLFEGDRNRGLSMCGLSGKKPVLMIMGGSLGAVAINRAVHACLDRLLRQFDIIHIVGKGNLDTNFIDKTDYVQMEYVQDGLEDIMAASDIILSRAGANAIWEFAALKKPMLLIPLPAANSRGDQILNAEYLQERGFAKVLQQEDITPDVLADQISSLWEQRQGYISRLSEVNTAGLERIFDVIMSQVPADKE